MQSDMTVGLFLCIHIAAQHNTNGSDSMFFQLTHCLPVSNTVALTNAVSMSKYKTFGGISNR
jgi:hypothetical protein